MAGVFFSCKPVYKVVNGVNKEITYQSKQDYCDIIEKKYQIDTSQMIFIDENDKSDFMFLLREENISFFYGIVLGLKNKIDDNYLTDVNNCVTRVSSLIESNLNQNEYKTKPTRILNFNYFDIKNSKVDIKNEKLILFIFSTKIGRENINKIKDFINKFNTKNEYQDYQYRLICVD